MSKRYRETLDKVVLASEVAGTYDVPVPEAFTWRGRDYRVLQVLGHWREDPGWWRGSDGATVQIEQTDLWRVEARNGIPTRGVYELVQRGDAWRLDKVWD